MTTKYVYNKDNPSFTYLVETSKIEAHIYYLHPFWSTTAEENVFTPVNREDSFDIGCGWEKLRVTREQLENNFCWEEDLG